MLAYLLDHEYEEKLLSRELLVGRDRLMISQLQEACRSTNLYVCLGTLENRVSGKEHHTGWRSSDPDDWEDFESSVSLKHVSEVDETEPFKGLNMYFSGGILQGKSFDCTDPVDEDMDDEYGYSVYRFRRHVSRPLGMRQ